MDKDIIPVQNANCTDEDLRTLSRLQTEQIHREYMQSITTRHVREAKQILDEYGDAPYLGTLFGYHGEAITEHYPHGEDLLTYFYSKIDELDPRPGTAAKWVADVAEAIAHDELPPHPNAVSRWRDDNGQRYYHCLRCGRVFKETDSKPCSCPVGVEPALPPEDGGSVQGGLAPGASNT